MNKVLLWLASLMVLVVVSAAQAQPPLPPGVEQELRACVAGGGISICAAYLESTTTTPPAVCCEPLENLIADNVSCACLLFGNEDVAHAYQIDLAKARTLPQRCGLQPFDVSDKCPASMAPARAPSMSTPNAPVAGREAGGANNIAWAGTTIVALLLLLANSML